MPPSEALGQLTSCVIRANAPSMSRLLNAEYACSIMVLVSAIHPPITLAMHSIIVMRLSHAHRRHHPSRPRLPVRAPLRPESTIRHSPRPSARYADAARRQKLRREPQHPARSRSAYTAPKPTSRSLIVWVIWQVEMP